MERVIEDNSRLRGIQEAQSKKIKELETLMERSEAKAVVVEEITKEAESSVEDRVKVAAVKAIEAFQASEEFCDRKVKFASNTYVTGQ